VLIKKQPSGQFCLLDFFDLELWPGTGQTNGQTACSTWCGLKEGGLLNKNHTNTEYINTEFLAVLNNIFDNTSYPYWSGCKHTHLYGLWLQTVTAGKGNVVLKLKSTLTLFGCESKYINCVATRNTNNALASKNISNHAHLHEHTTEHTKYSQQLLKFRRPYNRGWH